jgi:hypothetical protein
MAKFKVIKKIDFGKGTTKDKDGNLVPVQNFAPKVGDTINLGQVETFTIPPYLPKKGYRFFANPYEVSPSSYQIIPIDAVEEVVESTTADSPNTDTADNSSKSFLQNYKSQLILVGVLIAGYFAYKKFIK